MFAQLYSLGVWALDGFVVTAEVDVSGGLPQFAIVGLPDSAVKEATDRVRSAMKNLGFEYPARRVTVNLAPADTKKTGPVYDLPVLLGLLAATKQIGPLPQDAAFIGELSLDGRIRPLAGVLPMAMACQRAGIKKLFLPAENAAEAGAVEGIEIYGLESARDVTMHLSGERPLRPAAPLPPRAQAHMAQGPDFADVHGQPEARRAMEIAAVGMHNVILVGSPGAGKSMLAKRMPGILPPLGREEALEVSAIYSIAGAGKGQGLMAERPFRAPHHTASATALAGGGSVPRPGEVSLAHHGVLFMDELPEFQRDALETLRQPMEDGTIHVSRVMGTAVYPSRFMLVAAMNPCPCGYFGHPRRECRCAQGAMDRYLHKVSGPLLDRVDLHVEVQPVEYEDISAGQGGEGSAAIRARVVRAVEFARARCEREKESYVPNAYLDGERLRRACTLDGPAAAMMKNAFERMGLSARAYNKVLKIARSIADLAASEPIQALHVQEAVQYRNLDRKYWATG